MRCADYLFKTLADSSIQNVFAITGGGAMFLNDALGAEKRIRPVFTHHEQGASFAALGNTLVTGKLAVASVTTGPGGTNALPGFTEAVRAGLPVLFISGQVKMQTCKARCPELKLRQLGDQEINIIDIVKPLAKYAALVTKPELLPLELENALRAALTKNCGPVWLDIPINIQSAELPYDESAGFNISIPDHEKLPEGPVFFSSDPGEGTFQVPSGSVLAVAIGAAAAGKNVVAIENAETLMQNLPELQTIRSNRLPVRLVLRTSSVSGMDWRKIAEAFDWNFEKISSLEDAANKNIYSLMVMEQ